MYFKTLDFKFKTNDALDAELKKLYDQKGLEPWAVVRDDWFGKEYGGIATIKFKGK